MDMPLRVLDLVSQLGFSPDRILIESCRDGQSIDGVIRISEARGSIFIEKLRSMVLVWSATLVEIDQETPVDRAAFVAAEETAPPLCEPAALPALRTD